MVQRGLFGLALAGCVSVVACAFGTSADGGAAAGSEATDSADVDDSGAAEAGPTSSGSGDRGGSNDGDTTVGISGTAGTATGAPTTSDDGVDDSTGGTSAGTTVGDTSTDGGNTTNAAASCDELFMAAPGYIYCSETPDDCSFNADTNGGTCNQMCASLDSTCVAAFDNPNAAGEECDVIEPNTDTCDTERGTEICVCSRP